MKSIDLMTATMTHATTPGKKESQEINVDSDQRCKPLEETRKRSEEVI